jgi:chromosome segregation ATPase
MSFTDLMSSGRGPGVIGMLLALVVLVGFGVLFVFAFDEGFQGKEQSIESVIANQSKEIADLEQGIARGRARLAEAPKRDAAAGELNTLNRENRFRDGKLDSLRAGVTAAKEAIAAKQREIGAYKDEYRAFVRGRAKGTTMDRLETRGGDVYQKVSVREVTAVGMQIMHEGGQKRIPFEDLPAELQDYYQFDPAQKAAAVAREEAERGEHEAAVQVAAEAADRQDMERREKEAEANRERAARALVVIDAKIKTLAEEIRSLEQAIEIEVRKPLSRAPQMRQQLAAKQRERAALIEQAAKMRTGL